MIPQFQPKVARITRLALMLISGMRGVVRRDEATTYEQVVYAVQVGTWIDPVRQEIGVTFDLAKAPGAR